MYHYPGLYGTQGLGVDIRQLAEDIPVQHRKMFQSGGSKPDTFRDGFKHLWLFGYLSFQMHHGDYVAGGLGVPSLFAGELSKELIQSGRNSLQSAIYG